MNRTIIFFVITLAFLFGLSGQTTDPSDAIHVCGTPPLHEFSAEKYLENLQRANPAAYQEFLEKEKYRTTFNHQYSGQQVFWAHDFTTSDFYQIQATLRKTGGRVRIWVEDDSWNSQYVTQVEVDSIYKALEVSTASGSLDPSMGIVDIDTMLFGQPPNRNGDGIIDFLILDIKDDFDPDEGKFSFIAGYFYPNDQMNNSYSNQRDLLYLDSQPGIFYKDNRRTTTVLSTTAHELQHLIHYNYDTNEENWVNEGLSELAAAYCGYGIGLPYLYLRNTNRSLISFPQAGAEVADYAKVGLWTLYMAEQLGLDFIKALTQDNAHSISSYHAILPMFTNQSFNQIYQNWTIANYVNDIGIDAHYGYAHPEARGLQALETQTFYSYWQSTSGLLKQYGASYFAFRGQDTLQIDFTNLPDRAVMIRKTENSVSVTPITQQSEVSEFNLDDEFIMLLTNSLSERQYAYSAYAPFSLQQYREVTYDDYQTDGVITHSNSWSVANRFVVPSNGLQLNKIKFYNPLSNTSVRIQIYNDNGTGRPGNTLSLPINMTIANQNTWAKINLPTPIAGLSIGQSIYVGIEFLDAGKAIGYDQNNVGEGISFVKTSNTWIPLSAASTSSPEGVLMIRAIFEGGLVESGQPIVEAPSISLYPNPSTTGNLFLNAELNGPGELIISFYNVLGQKVDAFRQSFTNGGKFVGIPWDNGRNIAGRLPTGIYFSNMTFRNSITGKTTNLGTQKIIFLK